jgi:hypothetical protein
MSDVGGIVVEADVRGAWTGVRDQGKRPTCLACAVSDAHAHAHGLGHPLSAEFLYYTAFKRVPSLNSANGLTLGAADMALRKDGQPSELEWPYQAATPNPWAPPAVTTLWYGGLDQCAASASGVTDSILAGMPVVLGLRLVPGFNRVQNPPYIIDGSGPSAGGHGVLAVGLGSSIEHGATDLVLIRNSWGFRWGFGGHAWLPVSYLNDKLIGSRTLVTFDLASAA